MAGFENQNAWRAAFIDASEPVLRRYRPAAPLAAKEATRSCGALRGPETAASLSPSSAAEFSTMYQSSYATAPEPIHGAFLMRKTRDARNPAGACAAKVL